MTPTQMQLGQFVLGMLVFTIAAIGVGIGIGILWMKEKHKIWTKKEIEDQMLTTDAESL